MERSNTAPMASRLAFDDTYGSDLTFTIHPTAIAAQGSCHRRIRAAVSCQLPKSTFLIPKARKDPHPGKSARARGISQDTSKSGQQAELRLRTVQYQYRTTRSGLGQVRGEGATGRSFLRAFRAVGNRAIPGDLRSSQGRPQVRLPAGIFASSGAVPTRTVQYASH